MDILRLMDEAANIDDGDELFFDLTGGEPFLDFELLVEVVSHGSNLGGGVSCVTNASWALTDEIAMGKLTTLRNAGLTVLSVSVSRFHQEFIPQERARRAIAAAAALGLWTELKGAITNRDLKPGGCLQKWKESFTPNCTSIFPVLPHMRDAVVLPEDEYYREPGLPIDRCPGEMVSVDFDGVARSCCTLDGSNSFLVVGNALHSPLRAIHEAFRQGAKQRILRDAGPIAFAGGAVAAGLGGQLRENYAGPCDLCLHIQNDPALREIAEKMAFELEHTREA